MLRSSTESLQHLSNRLHSAFVRLAKDDALWTSDLDGALRHVTSMLATELDVARVSVWELDAAAGLMDCRLMFRAEPGVFERGHCLRAAEYPIYFASLAAARIIDASDALHDARTVEFVQGYLRPLGVGAMLDATLNRAGNVGGVLCIEHVGSARLWSRDEQNFAMSVADLLAQLCVFHELRDSERRYRSLFDLAGDAIFVIREGHITDCNAFATRLFDCSREALLASDPMLFLPATAGQPTVPSDGMRIFERVLLRPDGSEFDAEISLAAHIAGGEMALLAIVRDVSTRRAAEREREIAAQELEQSNNALVVVNSLANRLMATTDARTIGEETVRLLHDYQQSQMVTFYVVEEDGEWLHLMASEGFDGEALQRGRRLPMKGSLSGLALEQGELMVSHDVANDDRLDPTGKALMTARGVRSMVVMPLMYRDQPLGTVSLLYTNSIEDMRGGERFILQAIHQTVSLALANAKNVGALEYQTLHDSLTGLPNRTRLHQVAGAAFEHARSVGMGSALMLLDLDRFKEVNDTLGHQTGDQLLKQVATRLGETLQDHDAMVFRLGGDEFALLLRTLWLPDHARIVAQDISAALRRPFDVQGVAIELAASIGISLFPQHGETSNALLRCADVAMYGAKGASTGVNVYDPAQDAHSPRRLAMITELGSAIRGDQLMLHFQPKLDLQHGGWSGCEALVRWSHPLLGQIPPSDFIQFAEMSDLIRPLSLWVARAAMQQLRAWREAGLNMGVAINLSARNLVDATFPDELAALIHEIGVPASALELEITETALISDPDRALSVVERLAGLGCCLSIDDFGTGYSSLAYLKRMPLTSLKIDRSFVRDMLQDEQDAIIVRSTIGLAHSLGLTVVAEGVEDLATLERLRDFGCDQAQGYFLSVPRNAADLGGLLRSPPPLGPPSGDPGI
ncbi:MAG: EAL domain-containing protein [Moraxellaceae bacterium]|nr:EAL domain-containing protein [Moraxellaceae bacterium]